MGEKEEYNNIGDMPAQGDPLRPFERELTSTKRILQKAGKKLGTTPSTEYPLKDMIIRLGDKPNEAPKP